MKYINQLDAIRAVAVILVILSHWVPEVNAWKLGEIGVDIFFVLSGFLISGILLEGKKELMQMTGSSIGLIRNFIIRRALRIFPLYYLVIVIHYLINDAAGNSIRESIAFHITYTSNFFFVLNPRFDSLFTHLWSLSVEEQFYLLWPWFILFVKDSKLVSAIWLSILGATLFSFLVPGRIDKLMPACIGSFAAGGLLAFVWTNGIELNRIQLKVMNALALLSLTLVLAYPLLPKLGNMYSVTRVLTTVVTIRVIYYCLFENSSPLVNGILRNKVLIFLGRISYGIYLIHTLGPWLWRTIKNEINRLAFNLGHPYEAIPAVPPHAFDLIMQFLLVVFLAWLSWNFFESPIMRFKKYFEYTERESKLPA